MFTDLHTTISESKITSYVRGAKEYAEFDYALSNCVLHRSLDGGIVFGGIYGFVASAVICSTGIIGVLLKSAWPVSEPFFTVSLELSLPTRKSFLDFRQRLKTLLKKFDFISEKIYFRPLSLFYSIFLPRHPSSGAKEVKKRTKSWLFYSKINTCFSDAFLLPVPKIRDTVFSTKEGCQQTFLRRVHTSKKSFCYHLEWNPGLGELRVVVFCEFQTSFWGHIRAFRVTY